MLKKTMSYSVTVLLGLFGSSVSAQSASSRFQSLQESGINTPIESEKRGRGIIKNDCDDMMSDHDLIAVIGFFITHDRQHIGWSIKRFT